DRLDLEQLIRMLLALERGETRACRVVRVPTPDEEDAKRQHRERNVLVSERTAHSNRMTGIFLTRCSTPDSSNQTWCNAYIQGVADGLSISNAAGSWPLCIPEKVVASQVRDIVLPFIRRNP